MLNSKILKEILLKHIFSSKEICDKGGVGNITLCPLCDKACSYQSLSDSCMFARITYLFDNPSTVFFAIFMSFWGKIVCLILFLCTSKKFFMVFQ